MPEYEFKIIGDTRHGAGSVVSLNPSLGRITIYKEAWDKIVKGYGREVKYVKLGVVEERPDAFWIIPCEKQAGSRKVHFSRAGGTAMLSARSFFSTVPVTGHARGAEQFDAKWDSANKALEVDITELPARYAKLTSKKGKK
ncbi:MAG: hypothetical protein HY913_04185 [Desulfomonile tiedjei]|nr:hypothetical protein [Desulfomonile tiedjei]